MHLILKFRYVRMQNMFKIKMKVGLSQLAFFLVNSSTLSIGPVYRSETPVHFYQKTRRYITEDSNI
jgi:hypothetical protein